MCEKQLYTALLRQSEGCAWHNQHAEHGIARGSGGMPPEKFVTLHALRSNLRAFQEYSYRSVATHHAGAS